MLHADVSVANGDIRIPGITKLYDAHMPNFGDFTQNLCTQTPRGKRDHRHRALTILSPPRTAYQYDCVTMRRTRLALPLLNQSEFESQLG